MKPALLIILIHLLMSLTGFSQNWRLFRPEGTSYYASGRNIDIAFVPDSITPSGQDFIWHLSPKLFVELNLDPTCSNFSLNDGPFSRQILETSSGDYIWTSSCGPQIHMKTRPIAPWKIMDFPAGYFYDSLLAYPAGDYWGFALGQPDSIRRIELEVWQGGMVTSRDTTEISKTYGWLNPVTFYSGRWGCYFDGGGSFLAGHSTFTPEFGPATVRDFFSMQVGDTIQTTYYFFDDFSNSTEEAFIQDVYLYRNEGPSDTLTFKVDRKTVSFQNNNPAVLIRDTLDIVYPLGDATYRRLEKDWGKIDPVDLDASGWGYRWHYWLGQPYVPSNIWDFFDPVDTCFNTSYSIMMDHDYMYARGLGGPYFFGAGMESYGWRYPNYYRLNGVATGTPFSLDSILSIDAAEPSFSFQIFPNPSGDFIEVRVPESLKVVEVTIWDFTGRQLGLNPQKFDNCFRFELQGLPNGLYLISVSNGKKKAWQRLIRNQ